MIFFDSKENQIDITPGIKLSNFRKQYLVSALHFNDTADPGKDECGNKWKVNGNISIIEDSDIAPYRNMLCLNNDSSLELEYPIELSGDRFTIDLWMQQKVIEDNSTGKLDHTYADTDICVDLYTIDSNGTKVSFWELFYGGCRHINDNSSTTNIIESYGHSFLKNKNYTSSSYTVISKDVKSLHHFAFMYFSSYFSGGSTGGGKLSLWIDGYSVEYLLNLGGQIKCEKLYIKIYNKHTISENPTPIYISNIRVWDNVTLIQSTDQSSIDFYTSFPTNYPTTGIYSREFSKEIDELKEVKSKQMTKHNFLRNKTNHVYRNYIDDNGYIPKSPKLKEITDNDLIYLPFNDKTDVLKDLGSYGMTWENVTSKGRLSLSTYPTNYKIYDYKIKLNNSIHVTADTVTGSSTLIPYKKFYTIYPDSQSYPTYYVQKLFTGYIKSDKIFTFSNYPEFTIEFFAYTESILEDGKKRRYIYHYENDLLTQYVNDKIETINDVITTPNISTKNIKSLSHIALVYNSENVKKYVNGILTDTLSYTFEDDILKLQNTYYFDDVKNYYDTGPTGSAFQTSAMNKQYRVLSAYMGQFRIRNIAAYNEDFDPSQELFIYDQDIITYLNSQKQLLSAINVLLKYPVINPQTIYDIAYTKNSELYFKPEYNTTKYVDYDTYYTMQQINFPNEYYDGFYSVFSGINNIKINDIKFRINKLSEINYSVSCWIYIKANTDSDDYQDLLYISGINNFVGVQASPNGNIKIIHHKSQRYSTETRTSVDNSICEENIYEQGVENCWVYFEFLHTGSKMTIKIDNYLLEEIEEYSNKYLHRIILTTGARRTGIITPYYLGLTVTKLA